MLAPAKDIDDHISRYPKEVQVLLQKIRSTIQKAAPKATEKISYGIPTFVLEGNLVHFAGYKNHIGFYPGSAVIEIFQKELAAYETAKGTVQFPLDKPLPIGLITQIVKFRVQQNMEKAATKKTTGKKPASVKKVAVSKPVSPVKSKKPTDEEQVQAYLDKLDPAAKTEIEAVRKIIKTASSKLSERIKWNAPSYYYKEDIVTFGPYKSHKLLLVIHHPAVVKINSPLLEGDYKDRRLIHFANKAAAVKNKQELTRILLAIIKAIDKK
jgi:uncharacterized protein YdhG (YjbR/CyaY superfamily)